jgi:VWFA-related protein
VPYEPDDGPVGKFDARSGSARGGVVKPGMEEQILEFNNKVYDSFEVLGKLADRLSQLPGRKSLIWVTNGFPVVLDGRAVPGAKPAEIDYSEDMERSVARLNRADVAVYTLDPRGLCLACGYGDVGTLREFAARTGGTAFYDRNDVDEVMRLALEDSKVSYTLGFAVPADAAPGLHTITLRTKRPGVTLRYRESYQLDDPRVVAHALLRAVSTLGAR